MLPRELVSTASSWKINFSWSVTDPSDGKWRVCRGLLQSRRFHTLCESSKSRNHRGDQRAFFGRHRFLTLVTYRRPPGYRNWKWKCTLSKETLRRFNSASPTLNAAREEDAWNGICAKKRPKTFLLDAGPQYVARYAHADLHDRLSSWPPLSPPILKKPISYSWSALGGAFFLFFEPNMFTKVVWKLSTCICYCFLSVF